MGEIKWISVEERLPNDDECCLIKAKYDLIGGDYIYLTEDAIYSTDLSELDNHNEYEEGTSGFYDFDDYDGRLFVYANVVGWLPYESVRFKP